MHRLLATMLTAALSTALPLSAHAWGADGHETVGAIAARLIAGSPAEARVNALLGGLTLPQATVWADCVKGIVPKLGYTYPNVGKYASCAPLETPARIAEMADYVRRNQTQCHPKPGEESCHQQYHYTDVALQRSRYLEGFTGTSNHDVVAALRASIQVLRGQPAPAPFDLKPREALLLMVHVVGDMHEPLHVGAIYLDHDGHEVDPDKTGFDPATNTTGGNAILVANPHKPPQAAAPGQPPRLPRLHTLWDDVPASMAPAEVDDAWVAQARKVKPSTGDALDWPARWATQSLEEARLVYDGLSFAPKQDKTWTATLPTGYAQREDMIKRRELTLAGARLAQLLQTVFPN